MNILQDDKKYIWHPFTQHGIMGDDFVAISTAKGAYIFDENQKRYLDLISSWWVITHGHCHPHLVQAIYQQAGALDQIIFSGATHEPAAILAKKMQIALGGRDLWKVFFSDDGSTAVEVAIKMALQAQHNWGKPNKNAFIAFDGGYHGDTVGAMSVGRGSGFFDNYQSLLFPVHRINYPNTWMGDPNIDDKEKASLQQLLILLKQQNIAAIIVEPLIQGAAGMRVSRPSFLIEVMKIARENGALIIFDEVMTGFGRTGKLFAFHHLPLIPDIICLAKGLTGGMLPMSLTCASLEVFEAFLSKDFYKSLIHGHSFTANPIACALAIKSLELFDSEDTLNKILSIQNWHNDGIEYLLKQGLIYKPRVLGTIAAFDIYENDAGYDNEKSLQLRKMFIERGLWLRPLGGTVYLMPPYCITKEDISCAYEIISQVLQEKL